VWLYEFAVVIERDEDGYYVTCLNLFFRSNDGKVAIRGGRLILITRKAGSVVSVNAAPNEPPIEMRWLREKPMQISKYP